MRAAYPLVHAELAAMTDDEIKMAVVEVARPKYMLRSWTVWVEGQLILGDQSDLFQQVIHHVRHEQPVAVRKGGLG
jgi:hypothetical protein